MKTLLIAAIAAASLSFTATPAKACDYNVNYCAPYRVSTCVVSRCSYCKTVYDRCGNACHYTVTVVTYRDNYSDGSGQVYSRSFHS